MTIIKKHTNNRCQWGWTEMGMLVHSQWECKLVQPLKKIVWSFLKKLKLPYDPEIPVVGKYLKKQKHLFEKIHAPQCS